MEVKTSHWYLCRKGRGSRRVVEGNGGFGEGTEDEVQDQISTLHKVPRRWRDSGNAQGVDISPKWFISH